MRNTYYTSLSPYPHNRLISKIYRLWRKSKQPNTVTKRYYSPGR